MSARADAILADLAAVDRERALRAADPGLDAAVHAVKAYQQERFRRTYADLLADPRYRNAALFFLDELYGPRDFTQRDAQFARVVPTLVRLFSEEIIETVATLAALHALSERLDSRLAASLPGLPITATGYREAWQACGSPEGRERQIALTIAVGADLDRLTRKPLLRHSLRLMRGPAHAAGLGALQEFLESGFDTFRAMGSAQAFLSLIGQRERALAAALFAGGEGADGGLLGQLP